MTADNTTHDKLERTLQEIDRGALTQRTYTQSPPPRRILRNQSACILHSVRLSVATKKKSICQLWRWSSVT